MKFTTFATGLIAAANASKLGDTQTTTLLNKLPADAAENLEEAIYQISAKIALKRYTGEDARDENDVRREDLYKTAMDSFKNTMLNSNKGVRMT